MSHLLQRGAVGRLFQQAEDVAKYGGFIVKFAIAVGVLVVFSYCYSLHFYPSGVTLGDSLLFIFFSLGLTIVYMLVFYMLFCMGILTTPFFRVLQKIIQPYLCEKYKNIFPPIGILTWDDVGFVLPGGFMLLLSGILIKEGQLEIALGLVTTAIMIFVIWTLFLQTPRSSVVEIGKSREHKVCYAFRIKPEVIWILLILSPLLTFSQLSSLTLNTAANLIGVRAELVTVQIPASRVSLVREYVKDAGLADQLEVLPDGGAILRNVDILFQGIGTITLIAIRTKHEEFRFSVPSIDVAVSKKISLINLR
jgi:hypothetical protein